MKRDLEAAAARSPLLEADEPAAVRVERPEGASPFLLICDHAGNRLPRSLGALGLPSAELRRHIAWDIGADGLTARLAAALDACAILQVYSRLVIDCNRPLAAADAIATNSERTAVPGNEDLTPEQVRMRVNAIHQPYHARIRAELDARQQRGQPTILIAMHSFTPIYLDVARPWDIGVLYHRDARLAKPLLELLRADGRWCVGDNQPYAVDDEHDYSIPEHGERRGIPHVELEIRQDLIADEAGQATWAAQLAGLLPRAATPLHGA